MKKFMIIAVMLFMVRSMFAQEIVEVVRVRWNPRASKYSGPYDGSYVYLSNRQILRYCLSTNVWGKVTTKGWVLFDEGETSSNKVATFPVTLGANNLVGQKFQKRYDTFTPVTLQKVGTYTIKKASVRELTSEFTAFMNGDFSYKGAFIMNRAKAKGSISGSAKGGMRTIVNIFFDNGKKATIEASSDPIWLDAEPGMQVEHYKIGDENFYNLL